MDKIAIGSEVKINSINSKAYVSKIVAKSDINVSNIKFKIENEDKTQSTVIDFPISESQTLKAGEYISSNGFNKENGIINFTQNQQDIWNDLQNIDLYNGITYISTDLSSNAIMNVFYYEDTIQNTVDDKIYVLDRDEELLAVFNKEDENPIINPRIQDTQNAESVFTFSIAPNNPKWEQIKNPENLYVANNKVFSTNFEGCFKEDISDNGEELITVTAYERQKLLSRRYVRSWNSETGFEKIDTFMVVVLSNGNLPLKNNDELVYSAHLPGTSGYALDALLYGTGWKTGTCDVEGTFDLETDQVDVYENILKVQEIWGGILVFDSVNKIVHHRDETKWLPYEGFEVKYAKNMQSLEKLYNNKIITKLCPLGEGGLNIKKVNSDSEWLTNFSYTNSVLEGIENNADITDAEQLKRWGQRKLKDLCKPRKELTVKAALLYQVEGYELERVELNSIVDVINYQNIDGDIEQLRVVGFDYGIWDYSDATLELSDITLESTDIFKKSVKATNIINDGTLNSNKVVTYFRNGGTLGNALNDIDYTISKTKSDLIKSDEKIEGRITQTESDILKINGDIGTERKRIDDLLLDVQGLTNKLISIGGNNLIRNSVGAFKSEYWEGTIVQDTSTDTQTNNESKSAIKLQNGTINQTVIPIKNGIYNLSFNYKKILNAANCKVVINSGEYALTATNWTIFEQQIQINDNNFSIKFISDTNNACLISDLLLIAGKYRQTWSQNPNETDTDTVQIGKGIQVESSSTNTYTRIDSDGNRTYNKTTGDVVTQNTDKGTETETIIVRTQSQITGLLQQKQGDQIWVSVL